MALRLTIPKDQLPALTAFRDVDPEVAERVATVLAEATVADPGKLESVLISELGISDLAVVFLTLASLQLSKGETGDSVAVAIRDALTRLPDDTVWGQDEMARWGAVEEHFHRLLGSRAVRILAKGLPLMWEADRLLVDARVLTDVRPIFSEDAESVEAGLVVHTLRLKIRENERDTTISFSLDDQDLASLRDQCVRALRKSNAVRRFADKSQLAIVDYQPRPTEGGG